MPSPIKNPAHPESLAAKGRNRAFQATSEANLTISSPRLRRLAWALLERPRTVRELCLIVPSNNAAEYVRQLRSEYGLTIPCEHISFVTIDGNMSWYGKYSLTEGDRERLEQILRIDGGVQ